MSIPDSIFIRIAKQLQDDAEDAPEGEVQLPLELLLPEKNEGWQRAVQRLADLIRLNRQGEANEYDNSHWEALDDALAQGNAFQLYPPLALEKFAASLQQCGLNKSPPLHALFCEHGAFHVYAINWETGGCSASDPLLEIYRHKNLPDVLPLPLAIANNWSDHFCQNELTADQCNALEQRFFAFGRRKENTQFGKVWHYLLTDREGRFGSVAFTEEDYPASQSHMLALLQQGLPHADFNAFMTEQIQATLYELLQCNDLCGDCE